VECWWLECGLPFIVCHAHFRGQRYCSEACRKNARRVSLANAAKKYKESLQESPEAAVRKAARAKHNAHQAASRKRKKAKKVRSSDSDRSDFGRTIESGDVAAQSAPAAPPAVLPVQAMPAVVQRTSTRIDEAFEPVCTRSQCAVCGVHGTIRWVVNRDCGICRSAWKHFEPQDDP